MTWAFYDCRPSLLVHVVWSKTFHVSAQHLFDTANGANEPVGSTTRFEKA
jgi:hypothetical protein